jgi:hypothetical protein
MTRRDVQAKEDDDWSPSKEKTQQNQKRSPKWERVRV